LKVLAQPGALLLEKAIGFAWTKHKEQLDKQGVPYILHPLAVMEKMTTIDEKIVAVLHDVVEDTDATYEDLQLLGLNDTIVYAVMCITHLPGERRTIYIDRVLTSPLATAVKREDLIHNKSSGRIDALPREESERLTMKYFKDWRRLNGLD